MQKGQKRPTSLAKESYFPCKRDLLPLQKRPTTGRSCGMQKGQKRPTSLAKKSYFPCKRDLLPLQKRPTSLAEETCFPCKRDLLTLSSRLFCAKQIQTHLVTFSQLWHTCGMVCVSVKRVLFAWQKRPIHMAKEAHSHVRMGLFCRRE